MGLRAGGRGVDPGFAPAGCHVIESLDRHRTDGPFRCSRRCLGPRHRDRWGTRFGAGSPALVSPTVGEFPQFRLIRTLGQ